MSVFELINPDKENELIQYKKYGMKKKTMTTMVIINKFI